MHRTLVSEKKYAFPNSLNKEHLSKRTIRQVVNVVLQLTGPFRKISLRFQGYFLMWTLLINPRFKNDDVYV